LHANAALKQEIGERRKAEGALRALVEEKVVLLREIHHRVKNNIQIISSLLRLQSRSIRDRAALDAVNECQNRIRSIALIHEKLYQSQDFARVDFGDYIENMVGHLVSFHSGVGGRVRFRLEADDVKLDINRAIPCGLIVNELATNALKHAFPEGRAGEIVIRLRALDGGRHELAVKDTGVGLPDGIAFETASSLGFQIVGDLVKQLEGTVEIVRGAGTEFIVRF
jgi:two-component sensor histidine kinase